MTDRELQVLLTGYYQSESPDLTLDAEPKGNPNPVLGLAVGTAAVLAAAGLASLTRAALVPTPASSQVADLAMESTRSENDAFPTPLEPKKWTV